MNILIDVTKTVLKTQRMTLRPFEEKDLDDLFAYAHVDGVGQMAGWKPHENREESKMILNLFMDEKKTFAIEKEGRVIGSLGIEYYNEKRYPEFERLKCREIGYVLAKDCWGEGLMPEAVNEVIRWLFEEKHLDAAFCGHFLSNQRSERVMKKCGFKHYAYDRIETRLGTVEDAEMCILFRQDWEKSRQ